MQTIKPVVAQREFSAEQKGLKEEHDASEARRHRAEKKGLPDIQRETMSQYLKRVYRNKI